MDSVKRNIYNRLDAMEDKINGLERWRWFVLGAAALTILMIENINLIELFS